WRRKCTRSRTSSAPLPSGSRRKPPANTKTEPERLSPFHARERHPSQECPMNTTSPLAATGPNADQIDYWNSAAGENWTRYQDRRDAMLQPFSDAVLDLADIKPGARIMDIGCGCGATTLDVATRTGASGRALGVDISAPMIARAKARAASLGSTASFML